MLDAGQDGKLLGSFRLRPMCYVQLVQLKINGGSEWGSNPPVTGLPAARRF
jgi:hypothetical protein